MQKLSYIAGAALLMLAIPNMAQAQFAGDSGGDIQLLADDIVSARGVTTLTGQADIRQGDVRLLADTVKIYARQQGGGVAAASDIDRVEATGNFYYITADQEVRGERGVYESGSDTFTVTGDVILLQGESVVTGTQLVYHVNEERAQVTTDCQGRKCPAEQRVNVLIRNTNNNNRS